MSPTVQAPAARAWRAAATVSSVSPEYEVAITSALGPRRRGLRQISSYERAASVVSVVKRSARYLPEYMAVQEPPLPVK